MLKDIATLTIDASGVDFINVDTVCIKGSSLKETLVASLIKLTNWKPIVHLSIHSASGTIPIEAKIN